MRQLFMRLMLMLAMVGIGVIQSAQAQNTTLSNELNSRGIKPMTSANIDAAGGDPAARVAVGLLARTITVPAGLGWDQASYPISPTLICTVGGVCTGSAGYDPFASAAAQATLAGAQYYVAASSDTPAGNDGTCTTGPANPCRSIARAIVLGNLTAASYAIHFPGKTYLGRTNDTFTVGSVPTQDVSFIAEGGRLPVGVWDVPTPTVNATYANVYQWAAADTLRITDPSRRDQNGLYPDYTARASVAAVAASPCSFYNDGANTYASSCDGQPVTSANARPYRNVPLWNFSYTSTAAPNVFIRGATANDGFDFEGGQAGGIVATGPSTAPAYKRIFAVSGVTVRYASGVSQPVNNNVSVNRWPGLFFAINSDASAGCTDNWNKHNTGFSGASGRLFWLFVNVTATDSGRCGSGATSANDDTGHEDVIGIDVAGYYRSARGFTVHYINTSKTLLAGTRAEGSLGDLVNGGSFAPGEFRTSDTATIWADGVYPITGDASDRAFTATNGSTIYLRNMSPYRGVDNASGGTITPISVNIALPQLPTGNTAPIERAA